MNLLWYLGCQAINPNPISTRHGLYVQSLLTKQVIFSWGKSRSHLRIQKNPEDGSPELYVISKPVVDLRKSSIGSVLEVIERSVKPHDKVVQLQMVLIRIHPFRTSGIPRVWPG